MNMHIRTKKTLVSFKNILFQLVFLIGILSSASLQASEVYWAGVGFLGDFANKNSLYPYSSYVNDSCSKESGDDCLDVLSRSYFLNNEYTYFTLNKELAEKSDNPIGMAVGISYERVREEQVYNEERKINQYIINYAVYANVIFFNYSTNQFIESIPLNYVYNEVVDNKPSDKHIKDVYKNTIYKLDSSKSFFKLLAEKVRNVSLDAVEPRYAQIVNSVVDDSAWSSVNVGSVSKDMWVLQMAQVFENRLIHETNAPMLPSKVGHTIGNKLQIKLSQGDRTIKLPPPDFKLGLHIRLFKTFEKKDKYSSTKCFATAITINMTDSFDDVTVDAPLREVTRCSVIANNSSVNESSEYEKTLIALLIETAKNFANPELLRDFTRKASPEQASRVRKEITKANTLFFSGTNKGISNNENNHSDVFGCDNDSFLDFGDSCS